MAENVAPAPAPKNWLEQEFDRARVRLGKLPTNDPHAAPEPAPCGLGICAARAGHEGTCDEASGWSEPAPVETCPCGYLPDEHDPAEHRPARAEPAQDEREVVSAWLTEQAMVDHSWRCEHPDRYGPCDCADRDADEVLSSDWLADRDARIKADAAREALLAAADDMERFDAIAERVSGIPGWVQWLRDRANSRTVNGGKR